MSKVTALGGIHKSTASFFSQAMADPTIKAAVIVTFHDDDSAEFAHFECTKMQLAYASVCIQEKVTA